MCDCDLGGVDQCVDCELMELQAEHHALRSRCRTAAQTLIASVGAAGPMNVEQAAERAVARIAELEAREEKREHLIAAVVHAAEHGTANCVLHAAHDLAEYEASR